MLAAELDQWRPLLRKQVNGLVMGLKKNDALENVYRAEKHAHLLQSYAHSLHRYFVFLFLCVLLLFFSTEIKTLLSQSSVISV